jgi:hypothetical protein
VQEREADRFDAVACVHDAVAFHALLLIELMIGVHAVENDNVADVRIVVACRFRHDQ